MWEYKRQDINLRLFSELIGILNKNGDDGWEIIYYTEEKPDKFGNEHVAKILFKRLKNNEHSINNP
jgi:hypothetical protein